VVDEYSEAVVKLCVRLIEILSTTLGLEAHVLGDQINVKAVGLRTSFNHYPPCPQPELVLGIMPHADTSFVTVLQQDETPGLEIEKDGHWILVPPIQDAFVVNIGDLLQVIPHKI
jgi:isopenicillin N synthase-like dioxygenase